MTFLYHYTTDNGYLGIKGNFKGSNNEKGFVQQHSESTNGETVFWTPNAEQPMKFSYGKVQKPAGFYMTELAPTEANNKELAKLGVNLTLGADLYVFVFQVTIKNKEMTIATRKVHDEYASTHKFYITSSDTNGRLQIGFPDAVWCGLASDCPNEQRLQARR